MPRARLLLLAALALAACGSKTRLNVEKPHAQISPAALDFGDTPVLFPVQRTVLVLSSGAVPLHLTLVQLQGTQAGAFQVDPAVIEISPGATHRLEVVFRPLQKGSHAAVLHLETDDPEHPAVDVALAGTSSTSAALAVRPQAVDFGRVGEGQTAVRPLLVESIGQADLYLASLRFSAGSPDGFALIDAHAPATLPAGAQATVGLRYSPPGGAQSGPAALVIESSDPQHPSLSVPLSASINRAPIAVARGQVNGGPPRQGQLDTQVGATVQLDGALSTDPDGDLPLKLQWTLATQPQGSTARLADPSAAATSLKLDAPGSYSVLLAAVDAQGVPSLAPSRLDLRALPPEQLLVELIWDKVAPDLDLHFLQLSPGGVAVSDCNWTNPDPSWFPGGADQNPHHLGDKLTGYGPEQVSWKAPQDGDYRIDIFYKADHGAADASTSAEVRVFAFGAQVAELRHAFARQGETWTAGVVHWPAATVGVAP